MAFLLPQLAENTAGWGPPATIQSDLLPAALKDLPYQPFSKNERISKAADWTVPSRPPPKTREHQQVQTGFTFTENDDDDSEFRLVDSRTSNRTKMNRFRGRGGNRPGGTFRTYSSGYTPQRSGQANRGRQQYNQRGGFQQRGGRGGQGGGFRQGGGGGGQYGQRRHMGDNRRFDVSINVNPEWGDPVETWEFSKLTKIRETVEFPTDCEVLLECGKAGVYAQDFARTVSTKTCPTLARHFATERTFLKVTSSEDPNLRKFASEGLGNVFMTDSILSAILAMPRALYSWDLVVTKQNGQIWFDRRTTRFDSITVNENATDTPDNNDPEPLNTPVRLSAEAVSVQHNFSQQVLLKDKMHSFPYTSPFSTEANASTLAPVGYRYSVMPVGDFNVVVRAEIDAVKPSKNPDSPVEYVSLKTLNEYDAKVTGDWKKKIEVQRGGVLATELKNNMFKIQRWALQAVFAGASTIEIGFVSRQQPKDATVHSILSVQSYSPQEFFTGMNVNLNQMWSILKLVLDRINQEDDGKYLLFKDSATPNVKLYKIPQYAAPLAEEKAESSSTTGGLQILK